MQRGCYAQANAQQQRGGGSPVLQASEGEMQCHGSLMPQGTAAGMVLMHGHALRQDQQKTAHARADPGAEGSPTGPSQSSALLAEEELTGLARATGIALEGVGMGVHM